MGDYDEIVEKLKAKRDELKLQMHLGSKDAKVEWDKLEKKYHEFSRTAELDKSGEGVGRALRLLGDELKQGYERVHKAMKK